MEYSDNRKILLGDLVEISIPEGTEIARVVMLGESYERLELEETFISWVIKDQILEKDSIVVEWINNNPLAHNNLEFAPVGKYMFTGISFDIKLLQRAN